MFIMEYCDFLEHWEGVARTQLFNSSWVQSSHWLNVRSRPLPCAWQFGDVSCTPIVTFHAKSGSVLTQTCHFLDTFHVDEFTDAIIALSQSDSRLYAPVQSAAEWSFDFKLFKKGEVDVVGSSTYSYALTRSVVLNTGLQPGDYVVHVRTIGR